MAPIVLSLPPAAQKTICLGALLLSSGCACPDPLPHAQRWSGMQQRCTSGSHCEVPASEHWLLDASMDVETLTVRGCLRWDTSKEGLELRAGYVFLDDDGYLEIGTPAEPMIHRATVYLRPGANHPDWGTRFLFGVGNSRIQIHGRALDRSWTLLAKTAAAGDTKLHLKHDVHASGWRVGDTIGIATTNRGQTRPYTIKSVLDARAIEVDPPLVDTHLGGQQHISLTGAGGTFDRHFELAAEVVNLQRSVVITGAPNWDTPSREGLHTGMQSTGFMDVRYARVENCGQPPRLGKYCLHFHRMHQCPKCVFQGNAVVNSTQGGITIHGTHKSLVDQNVLWNTASVGIYVEDGNEMNNTISENVIICMHRVPQDAINPNKPPENCQHDLHNEPGRLGGIFVIGMTNDFIGNRIVNMENGIWFKGSADPNGRGAAAGRICTSHAPFGKIRGNVCHDNRRFGIYPDFQLPRRVHRDEDGMLPKHADGYTIWSSCDELTADGHDNGAQPANVIEDELDYHNMFVGQYYMGDVEYRRYTGINNGHCMYWKSSKNFADHRSYHMRDSLCISDGNDPVFRIPSGHLLGPAGAFTFRLKNVTFAGNPGFMGAISAGQHCMLGGAGGPCNVQYLMESVDFSAVPSGQRYLNFGAHGAPPGEVMPVFLAKDASLGGNRAVVSKHLDGFKREGCTPLGAEYDSGLGCPFSVRRFNVWTKDLGPVRLLGPGYDVPANPNTPSLGQNAGFLQYAKGYNGYGALVIPGKTYKLETQFASGIRVDFSEWFLPKVFGTADESIHLTTDRGRCTVHARDASGLHYGRFGPSTAASAGDCGAALGESGRRERPPDENSPAPAPQPSPDQGCHTAIAGEDCYGHVSWAMQHGMKLHPGRYDGLTRASSFEDFQAFLHRIDHGSCPRPCPAEVCHTATESDECYGHVVWAMEHGIRAHPENYEGLSESSRFEDFQSFLHHINHGNCQLPCTDSDCHTVAPDEECYGHVAWAKEHGIKQHPDGYDGLTARSSFEEFQAYLHRVDFGDCPKPCAAHELPAAQEAVACHTAVAGEECFAHVATVVAASLEKKHASRRAGLTAAALFEAAQEHLHQQGIGKCPNPCPAGAEAPDTERRFEIFSRPLSLGPVWPPMLTLALGLAMVLAALPIMIVTVCRLRARHRGWSRIVPAEPSRK